MLVVSLFLGIFIVKIGVDNSKTNQYTREVLQELREIKEILRDQEYEENRMPILDYSNIEFHVKNDKGNSIHIDSVEVAMNSTFPSIFKSVLLEMDGFLTNNGILIYGTEEIEERNLTWEVADYAKGYVAIGDDSGGRIFVMAEKAESTEVFILDCGDMNPENAIKVSDNLIEWINNGLLVSV